MPSTAQLPHTEKFWCELHRASKRRKAPRLHADVPICLSLAKGPDLKLSSNDLSWFGMQVRCDRQAATELRPNPKNDAPQTIFPTTLQLDIEGISLPITAYSRVAHMTLVAGAPPESEIAIGFAFVRFEQDAQTTLYRFIEQHLIPAGWP
ncbi:MAG: hypothetical protein ACI9DC_000703 [Gammaproteobacteria bacterium]|jgi:hypothetical protein